MEYITTNKISAAKLTQKETHQECGGICSFEGVVRNHHKGKKVKKLIYEAYEPMAEKVLLKLKTEIEKEWPDCHISVMHRYGELQIGDVAVAIVAWSPHRAEAFTACQAMIDRIKKQVPIWKQEFYVDGSREWVECCHHGT